MTELGESIAWHEVVGWQLLELSWRRAVMVHPALPRVTMTLTMGDDVPGTRGGFPE